MHTARIVAALVAALAVVTPSTGRAHCDGLDGPVVQSARRALDAGRPDLALAWVRAGDEPEVRAAFDHALQVRKLGPEGRALADRFFFETLVRVHRAGEGAPYAGLAPAGRDLGPAIPAAEAAIASGSSEKVEALLVEAVRHGLRQRLAEVRERRPAAEKSVEAGRAYVAAYVPFLHYVEGLHQAATRGPAHGEAEAHAVGPEEAAAEGGAAHRH